MKRLVGLCKRLRAIQKFSFPFIIDRSALKVIEMHGFSPEEINLFKDKAVAYFRAGPDGARHACKSGVSSTWSIRPCL